MSESDEQPLILPTDDQIRPLAYQNFLDKADARKVALEMLTQTWAQDDWREAVAKLIEELNPTCGHEHGAGLLPGPVDA